MTYTNSENRMSFELCVDLAVPSTIGHTRCELSSCRRYGCWLPLHSYFDASAAVFPYQIAKISWASEKVWLLFESSHHDDGTAAEAQQGCDL